MYFISINNFLFSRIEAYNIKVRKKVIVKNTQLDLMKNGSWEIKGTSLETGILLFKIVGRNKPKISQSRFE